MIAAWLTAGAPATRPASSASADSLSKLSEDLFVAGQYDSLIKVASTFVRRAEAVGDSVLLGRALTQRGRALVMFGRPGAERDIDAGIHIAESVRDTMGLMPAVNFKGFARLSAGRPDEATRCFERRLMLAQRTHSPIDEAWARTSLGLVFHNTGDQKRARQEYERALALFHDSGKKRLEISPLIGLGRVESALGNGPASIRWYRRALSASVETGDRMNEMWSANNLAVMETKQGDLSRSWEYLQHAIALARELKSPWGMVVPACNLAAALQELGDFETAQSVLDETRTLCKTQGAADQLPTVDFQFALLRMEQGRNSSAAALLRRLTGNLDALEAQHRDMVFTNLAQALASCDSAGAGIALLSAHLSGRGALYGDAIPNANLVLGHLYAGAGDMNKAIVCARRAHDLAIPAGQKRTMVASMFLESECLRASGDRPRAAVVFYSALDSLDAVRGGISTADWREVYGTWVSQDVIEAGRVLLEYPESSSRASREQAFFDAVQRVKTRTLIDRIVRPHGDAGDVPAPLSNRVATLSDLQSRLHPGEAVLDFCEGTEHSFLCAVTTDSLRIVPLPGRKSSLADRIQLLRTVVASTDPALRSDYDVGRLSGVQRELGRDILGAVTDIVERSNRVFVCPDGYFSAVPFGLLVMRDGGDVLMQDRDIVQMPSIGVLVIERSLARRKARGDGGIVAISASGRGLSGARNEVRDLENRYRHVDHFADLHDVDAFARAARRGETLHIASHALVIDRAPWWSGIQLRQPEDRPTDAAGRTRGAAAAPGGRVFLSGADSLSIERAFPSDPYVRAWEIAKLDIPAQLAVLSACETAGGRMTTGEGTLGLTAAFLSAGVPVVVASMWPVDDRVTAIIMRSFYRHLASGEPVATALRLAQLEASRSSRYAHPFYWAGFTVVGDGSVSVPIETRIWPWNPLLLIVIGLAFLAAAGLLLRRRRARSFVG